MVNLISKNEKKYMIVKVSMAILILVALTLTACSGARARKAMSIEQKMEKADTFYEEGRYNRAADLYLDIVFERSSRYTPNAQFRLAESYFNMARYNEAIYEYQELIRLFPEHSNINIAFFRIGEANMNLSLEPHYCQKETVEAIDAFNTFIDRFPLDPKVDQAFNYIEEAEYKLLEKRYHNGYIYYRLYDYSGALMYFDEIMEEGLRDEIDKKSRYHAARIYIERKDRQNTEKMLRDLQEYYPQAAETSRITRLFNRTFD